MKSLTILAVCGAGLGSSFACEMSIEAALKDMGIKAALSHCDISSAASTRADIIMTGSILNLNSRTTRLVQPLSI